MSGSGKHPKNFGTPYLFIQSLKTKLGLWEYHTKATVTTKNGMGLG